jgi:hypothetical protein
MAFARRVVISEILLWIMIAMLAFEDMAKLII